MILNFEEDKVATGLPVLSLVPPNSVVRFVGDDATYFVTVEIHSGLRLCYSLTETPNRDLSATSVWWKPVDSKIAEVFSVFAISLRSVWKRQVEHPEITPENADYSKLEARILAQQAAGDGEARISAYHTAMMEVMRPTEPVDYVNPAPVPRFTDATPNLNP